MEKAENIAIKPKKIKISAAAVAAAALAIVWILLEVAFFISEIPVAPELLGVDYCMTENEKGIYTIRGASSVRFSGELGRIENVSFIAQATELSEYNSKPVTVKVRGYDRPEGGSLITYKTQKIAVGDKNSVRTTVNVDVPENAGQMILEFGHEGGDYLVGEIVFNYSGGASFNFPRTGIVLAAVAILYLCARFGLFGVYFDPRKHGAAGLALCLLCVVISICLVGLFGTSPITVEYPFEFDVRYYDPYEQQFYALMKGQLHLDVEPSKGLLGL
jgi:hypothetical protein